MPTTTISATLQWDVLVTTRKGLVRDLPPGKEQWTWVPTSATLIFGQRDAVLVDAFLTVEQAAALVEWVAASGKNLTTIYVTHGHGDHCFGIGTLLNRFPKARAVATLDVVESMRRQASPEYVSSFWNARYAGQLPEGRSVRPSRNTAKRKRRTICALCEQKDLEVTGI
jgi:glyoxylase-like metal-dependent hydrolase (beta-lactamase superfamily II)